MGLLNFHGIYIRFDDSLKHFSFWPSADVKPCNPLSLSLYPMILMTITVYFECCLNNYCLTTTRLEAVEARKLEENLKSYCHHCKNGVNLIATAKLFSIRLLSVVFTSHKFLLIRFLKALLMDQQKTWN